MRAEAKEALIERREDGDVEDRVRVEVVQLQPVEEEQPRQKVVDGLREATDDGGSGEPPRQIWAPGPPVPAR